MDRHVTPHFYRSDKKLSDEQIQMINSVLSGESVRMPKQILAIGGPKLFEMLPYMGREKMIVPIPVNVKWEDIDINAPPTNVVVNTETYRVEQLRDGNESAIKLIYVHESIEVEEALELLKDGLMRMFIGQPYAA